MPEIKRSEIRQPNFLARQTSHPHNWYCESCAMYRENDGTCGNESLQIKRAPQSWCYVEEVAE